MCDGDPLAELNGHVIHVERDFTDSENPVRIVVCVNCGGREVLEPEHDVEQHLKTMYRHQCRRAVIREPSEGAPSRMGLALRKTAQSWSYLETFRPDDSLTGWNVKQKFAVASEEIRRVANVLDQWERRDGHGTGAVFLGGSRVPARDPDDGANTSEGTAVSEDEQGGNQTENRDS